MEGGRNASYCPIGTMLSYRTMLCHTVLYGSSHYPIKCKEELVPSSELVPAHSGNSKLICTPYNKQGEADILSYIPSPQTAIPAMQAVLPSRCSFMLDFFVFPYTRGNKAYPWFIPLNSLLKKYPAIGFRKLLAVVSKCFRNILSNNTKEKINN